MQTPWTEGIPRLEVAGGASPGPSATTSASKVHSSTPDSDLKSTFVFRREVANRARVSNPPNCADQGLRLKRRRDQVAKRPNAGRTAARAGVEGRHLPNGSAGRLRPRFRNFRRGAWRPEEHGPFLGPNPSIQNHRGSEARRSYSAAQLEYYLTYKPPGGGTKSTLTELGSSGVTTGRTARDGALYSSAPKPAQHALRVATFFRGTRPWHPPALACKSESRCDRIPEVMRGHANKPRCNRSSYPQGRALAAPADQ